MSNELQQIQTARKNGALVFVNDEHFQSNIELYRTEVTTIQAYPDDFHNIQGKFSPKKEFVDRISEAVGLQFIASSSTAISEMRDDTLCGKRTVVIAREQGRIRMPDGSWRESTIEEYEFDPVLRAMLDKNVTEINDKTKPLIAKLILDYTKFARQRAKTGARVRVIRQLIGMETAFTKDEISLPMVFSRVVQNTSYILQTPEGRAMATAQALGMDISSLFGGKASLPSSTAEISEARNVTPDIEPESEDDGNIAANLATEAVHNDVDTTDSQNGSVKLSEFDRLTSALEDFIEGYSEELNITMSDGKNPYQLAIKELNNFEASKESRHEMIFRIRNYLTKKGIRV